MWVKVALLISKPIRRGGVIVGSKGGHTWVTYRYERLLMFCHYCGLLGHDVCHCDGFFTASKSGGKVDCQYGEWLKSMGARSWSPPKGGHGQSTHKAKGAEEGDVSADKNGNDLSNNEGGEISVTGPDSLGVNACLIMGDVTVTELMASTCMESNSVGPGGAEVSEVLKPSEEHGIGNSKNGPSKPQPKWNRLLRMDCGPVEETKGELVTSLGKRNASTILEEDNVDSIGMHGSKRGRTQFDLEVFAEAGVSKHPCQSQ